MRVFVNKTTFDTIHGKTEEKMTKDRLSWIIGGFDWEQLTDWEERFVESCERYFEKKGDLTDPMENKLEEIFREKSR